MQIVQQILCELTVGTLRKSNKLTFTRAVRQIEYSWVQRPRVRSLVRYQIEIFAIRHGQPFRFTTVIRLAVRTAPSRVPTDLFIRYLLTRSSESDIQI